MSMVGCYKTLVVAVTPLLLVATAGCKKLPRRHALPLDAGLSGGTLLFEEDFEHGLDNWISDSSNWKTVDGRLFTGERPNDNRGIWLANFDLPRNFRVEFDATAVKGRTSEFEGDIKCEFGGHTKEHGSGYIVIFGGWKNTVSTIAKHNEHGEGRLATDTKVKVEEGRTYRFQIIRLEKEIKWFLDSKLMLRVTDREIETGPVFGFNNWNSRVYFDNLKVFAL